MIRFNFWLRQLILIIVIAVTGSCKKTVTEEPALIVREDPAEAARKAKETRENTAAQLADGLTLSLWASDSLAPDPVAMSIDDQGNVYLTRTNRQKNSEFDIRGYRHWMTPSISWETVEDRRKFLHEFFAPEKSKDNEWLADLNNDGSHDWRDLAIEKDEVWKLEDRSGDGMADISTRILNDFHDEITDVAGGLLVRENDMFVGIGPDLWRVRDTNGNSIIDEKTSISHGYAVHIGFSGHGMSGVTEGPDGKIYWGIGDIGASIKAPDGTEHKYPNEGIIVRSNPDGSNFEVFAAGLRNTHEFVFDEYGNIISSDNDGDHPGESERLVHIVEGSDAGWRSNWQYGKYTDPRNNTYKVWMEEGFYKPRWEGQASHIIPPIINFHNGPTGMAYNPGTALGSEWKNKFFLVEFVGNPSRSHVWAFSLKPKGVSFELNEDIDVVNGILPTGIRFGPDGALYVADWINGWGTKNYGRVWKLDVTEERNDLKAVREETKRLIQSNYKEMSGEELQKLLSFEDMRVRQKAQFELVRRDEDGGEILKQSAEAKGNQFARIHGIWGIGQLAANDQTIAASLVKLLKDNDAEIVAQAAKVIGDIRYDAADQLMPLLTHQNERVKFFAAQALGRLKDANAVQPLLELISKNNDGDLYLRHAAVLALSRIGQEAPITALVNHPSRAMRTAAVLVLRRMKNEKVAMFLKDDDELIVTDAARAINDDLSIPAAMPALAEVLKEKRFTSEALLRRGINACLRVGGEKELEILMTFANRSDIAPDVRAEALATIGTWPNPSVLDRVDGRFRGKIERDPAGVIAKVNENVTPFLQSTNPDVLTGAASMLSELGIRDYNAQLEKIMVQSPSAPVRSSMLIALEKLKYEKIQDVIRVGMNDKDESVRTAAIGLLSSIDIDKDRLPAIVEPIFTKGTIGEQQRMLSVLGDMPVEKSEPVLEKLIGQLANKKLSPALTLDLIEAVDSTHSENLINKLNPVRAVSSGEDSFSETLYGGTAWRGRGIFMSNPTAQCARCHTVGTSAAGTVGPPLGGIGNRLSREQLLESLVEPSARLAPGFGTVRITLKDNQVVTGILMEESATELILRTSDAEPLEIAVSRISKRENLPSSMPPMGTLLSKRDIRDVIEFLANLKDGSGG